PGRRSSPRSRSARCRCRRRDRRSPRSRRSRRRRIRWRAPRRPPPGTPDPPWSGRRRATRSRWRRRLRRRRTRPRRPPPGQGRAGRWRQGRPRRRHAGGTSTWQGTPGPDLGKARDDTPARAGGKFALTRPPGAPNMPSLPPPPEIAVSLRLAPIACALVLAACGGGQPGPDAAQGAAGAEDKVLNVYNWSDYVAPDTIADFEAATGIRVNYDVYAENETLETKLTTGGSGYDVVFPSARPFAQRQLRAGLYAPLDASKLPNLQHLDPAIMAGLADIDPGNAHVVPYMWGTTGLGINVEKVTAALGAGAALDTWGLLFDPANAAKLASCGIHVLDDEQEAFSAALLWLGMDPNAGGEAEIEAVKQAYAAIRPHIRTFNNAEYKDALANGDACLV